MTARATRTRHTCQAVTGRTDARGLTQLPRSRRGPARTDPEVFDVLCGHRAKWLLRDDDRVAHFTCDRCLPDVLAVNLGAFGSALVFSVPYLENASQ